MGWRWVGLPARAERKRGERLGRRWKKEKKERTGPGIKREPRRVRFSFKFLFLFFFSKLF
jgi:hypothetical protein